MGGNFSKYDRGVFSCWLLSVRELLKAYPHAFDLLRLCSFLSPDGVSEDLLVRGIESLDWTQNGNLPGLCPLTLEVANFRDTFTC
jgi:hypothetical protein